MRIPPTSQADFHRRNLSILEQRFPHVARQLGALHPDASQPIFALAGEDPHRAIHIRSGDGRSQPLYETAALGKLLQKVAVANAPESYDMVFFLGIGLGQAALEAVRRYTKKPRIVILEPYPALAKLALENTDLEPLLTYGRLQIYMGADADAETVVGDCQHILPVGRTLMFIHPYRQQMLDKRYAHLVSDLTHRIRSVRDRWHTIRRFGGRMLANSVSNLTSLLQGTPLRALRGRFKNVPAICIAAGPSLNQALPLLKGVNHALLVACDSAVGTLLAAGICPHIVVTADIHPTNIAKLKPNMEHLRDAVLAFGIESNPENVESFLGPRRVGMTAYSKLVLDWFDNALDLQCGVPQMTSVTHLAVSLAMAMGTAPIVLVGVDLAYLDGQSHARGSVATGIPAEEKLIAVPGNMGQAVYAPPQLVTDRMVLEQNFRRLPCRVISTSLRGALIKETELKPLERVIDTELKAPVDVKAMLDAICWSPLHDNAAASDLLSGLVDRLIKLKENSENGYWTVRQVSQAWSDRDAECDLQHMYNGCMADYGRLLKKYDRVIRIFQEAMLADEQEIIKKEESDAGCVNVSCERRLSDRLATLAARYQAMAKSADHVLTLLASLQGADKKPFCERVP